MVTNASWFKIVIGMLLLLLCNPLLGVLPLVSSAEAGFSHTVCMASQHGVSTIITYQVSTPEQHPVQIQGREYIQVSVEDGALFTQETYPDLPSISRSILIDEPAFLEAQITTNTVFTYENIAVAPSKGNLPRTTNPEEIPFTFNTLYTQDLWYPNDMVTISEPYMVRDLWGVTVTVTPFQYNPVRNQLRFYPDLNVELTRRDGEPLGHSQPQELHVDEAFIPVYQNQFMNFNLMYIPVAEPGSMLVITPDTFWSTMVPFVQWKNMKGIRTEAVNLSSIGTDANSIKNYITAYYLARGLTYVLLVGDASQCPTLTANGQSSDPSYSYIVGDDHYPDVFVGRFSAETIPELETQVQRTLEYEMNPQTSAVWYQKGTGIGSSQGPGDDNEYDWQHIRGIRADLLNYGYTHVDELYDGSQGGEDAPGSPTASMVATVINDGRGIINYCGHGTETSWSTSGFNSNYVTGLTNDNMLPFIFSVACYNGRFVPSTCFAEAWLRSTHNGEPVGALAVFMSSRSQAWSPPMCAQDEMVDLLVESYEDNVKNTFGGVAFSGCMLMNDQYGAAGSLETDAWHVFGDPSVQVRTRMPQTLVVQHDPVVYGMTTRFNVTVPGVENAVCALSRYNVLLGVGVTNDTGCATIELSEPLHGSANVDLVVTAYNAVPFMVSLPVSGGGAPPAPQKPSGPTIGDIDTEYTFLIPGVVEPEEQDVNYYVDWGDGFNTGWFGPYHSGEGPISVMHHWEQPGVYAVTVKAEDVFENESGFSEPLIITISQRLEITKISGGFGVHVTLTNTLPTSKYVNYSISIAGGQLPGFHVNKQITGTVYLKADTSETIKTPVFFALGRTRVVVSLSCSGVSPITETREGFSLFFLLSFH